jgi:hypothetical protein
MTNTTIVPATVNLYAGRPFKEELRLMIDMQALRGLLTSIEGLADKGPDYGRIHLADLLDYFRPRLSRAALSADEQAFSDALNALLLMVKRYLMTTAL